MNILGYIAYDLKIFIYGINIFILIKVKGSFLHGYNF